MIGTAYPPSGMSCEHGLGGYHVGEGWRGDHRLLRAELNQLIQRIMEYDELRLGLERHGGKLDQLERLSGLLKEPLAIDAVRQAREVKLTDQRGLQSALLSLDPDVHLQVRLKSTHMPVYYICRTKTDYWAEYSLVVEDYYQSPGYPVSDERFTRLMRDGHEKSFLHLSRFRNMVARLLKTSGENNSDEAVDGRLHHLGQHVFQASWHRDQQVAVLVAEHLKIPSLSHAVELLYLCLSGDLCAMRGALNPFTLAFFEEIYPQPAIKAFLERLPELSGETLAELPQCAIKRYAWLTKAFSRFLTVTVPWSDDDMQMPLWKLIYANLSRLDLIGEALLDNRSVRFALRRLEELSNEVIAGLLDGENWDAYESPASA